MEITVRTLQSVHSYQRDYTSIIGRMEKETHSSDAACIVEKPGIDQFDKDSATSSTEPFWKDFQKMTQQRGPSVHKVSGVISEVDILKKLYTPALA